MLGREPGKAGHRHSVPRLSWHGGTFPTGWYLTRCQPIPALATGHLHSTACPARVQTLTLLAHRAAAQPSTHGFRLAPSSPLALQSPDTAHWLQQPASLKQHRLQHDLQHDPNSTSAKKESLQAPPSCSTCALFPFGFRTQVPNPPRRFRHTSERNGDQKATSQLTENL